MSRKSRLTGVFTVLFLGLVLSFQNCSTGEYGLYGSRSSTPFGCYDEYVCYEDADQLWVDAGPVYPIYVQADSPATSSMQVIEGECNDGGFPDNKIDYRIYRVQGSTETQIRSGQTQCDATGRFRFRVNVCLTVPNCQSQLADPKFSYFVNIKIRGINEYGDVMENLRYPSEVTIPFDVLTFPAP